MKGQLHARIVARFPEGRCTADTPADFIDYTSAMTEHGSNVMQQTTWRSAMSQIGTVVKALRRRIRLLRVKWHHVADIADFGDSDVIGRVVADRQIALYRHGGTFHATSGWCTHGNALLCNGEIVDGLIECPAHFGYFDIVTGKAQGAPVTRDLDVFPVRIDGTRLSVGL